MHQQFVDAVNDLNTLRFGETQDPEIATRIAAYEMAYRMQTSVPELTADMVVVRSTKDEDVKSSGKAEALRENIFLIEKSKESIKSPPDSHKLDQQECPPLL